MMATAHFFVNRKTMALRSALFKMIRQECFLVNEHVHGHGIHFPLRRDQWRWNLKVMQDRSSPTSSNCRGRFPGFKVTLGTVHLKILCFGLRSICFMMFFDRFKTHSLQPVEYWTWYSGAAKKTVRKNSCSPKKGTTNQKHVLNILQASPSTTKNETLPGPSRNW